MVSSRGPSPVYAPARHSHQSAPTARASRYESVLSCYVFFFFFNDTATTEIYTLSLHDALPICAGRPGGDARPSPAPWPPRSRARSEEHTSELQSRLHLVCRLLLEKKKKKS